ncbi:MAG: hypothetical protein L6R43_14915 [Planctomycetes bacterium]|nr:hypothetical protein [Planctomycetota bacterium]
MSVDLVVLLDRKAPEATPEWLLHKFASNPSELAQVVERYRSRWRVQEWRIEDDGPRRVRELLGPGGFVITVDPRRVKIYHLIRFSMFAVDVQAREELRKVWRWLARLVGSSRAIYTHELMPYTGSDLAAVESGLRSTIGRPARDFEEMAAAAYFGPKAWYIDDFAFPNGTRQ